MTLDLLTPAERPPAVPLFVELCAGTAALSLRLQQVGARPPISRMGAKTGYADAILAALGLAPGMKAACYLWCEPDDGARALLMSYALPSLRREAADIILSWKDEDPRALWERLRAEGPIKGVDGREVARAAFLWGNAFRVGNPDSGIFVNKAGSDDPSDLIRGTLDGMARRLSASFGLPPTATTPDARAIDPREVARFLTRPESVDPDKWPEVVICADGAMVDAREVARWARIVTANRLIPLSFQDGRWCNSARNTGPRGGLSFGGDDFCTPIDGLASAMGATTDKWPPTTITADARDLLHMWPESARLDSVDCRTVNAEPLGEDSASLGGAPDVPHCIFVEDGSRMRLTDLFGPVPFLVGDVFSLSAPTKVDCAVIVANPIEVTNDGTFRSGPVEGATHEAGDSAVDTGTTAKAKHDLPVSILAAPPDQWTIRVDGADLPVGRNLVSVGVQAVAPFALRHSRPPFTCSTLPRNHAVLPVGTIVFADPPYQDTTGYAHDFPRHDVYDLSPKPDGAGWEYIGERYSCGANLSGDIIGPVAQFNEWMRAGVLTIARRWADAGAAVVISEAVPLGSIVHEGIADAEPGPLEGWYCYEITGCRVGQKRTFSAQQREWLTMSRPADKAWAAGLALANRQARNASEREPARETLGLFG